jgi:hypothetical protein
VRGQIFTLLGVEDRIAFEERNSAFGFFALVVGVGADDAVGMKFLYYVSVPSRSRHGPRMTEYKIVPDGPKGFGVEVTSPDRSLSVRGFATEIDAVTWIEAQQASESVANEGRRVGSTAVYAQKVGRDGGP